MKIGLCGTMSVGKTTLVNALKELPEFKDYHGIKHQQEKEHQDINMKIGFCGTMSVGKTTLVNALKELPEFKDYNFRTERSKYLMEMGIPLNTDSTFKGQIVFAAERAAELMQENIITDRTIIDVMAFCELSKSMSKAEKDHINGVLWHLIKEYDIIFHIDDLSVPIEDNGVRETDKNYRLDIHQKISSILGMYRYMPGKVVTISGTTEERIYKIKKSIDMYNI